MGAVTGLLASKGITDVGGYVCQLFQGGSSDFNEILSGLVQPDTENNTNEEELFAGIVAERIGTLKGMDAAANFQELLETEKGILQRSDGITSYESATNMALEQMVYDGTLTYDEANTIHAQAFEAAQLDENLDALYDGRGSENDPTVARMEMESALERARLQIEGFDDGSFQADTTAHGLSLSTVNKGGVSSSNVSSNNVMDGDGGFLWKPESDNDGKLVVLLPASISNSIEKVILKDLEGNEIESGNFTGLANADNEGERAHYRFSKSGGSYPDGVTVEVTLTNGETVSYTVSDSSERCD